MKVEDSSMPEKSYWNSLFDIEAIVDWLQISKKTKIIEIGSGYGTFTVPIARANKDGVLVAYDIESSMVEATRKKLISNGVTNAECELRDVLAEGTGIESGSADMVLLFNILHFDKRRILLEEASRVLKKNGVVAILHWRKDIPTPRGPANELRPGLEGIKGAAEGLPLQLKDTGRVIEPYHWGIKLIKCAQ